MSIPYPSDRGSGAPAPRGGRLEWKDNNQKDEGVDYMFSQGKSESQTKLMGQGECTRRTRRTRRIRRIRRTRRTRRTKAHQAHPTLTRALRTTGYDIDDGRESPDSMKRLIVDGVDQTGLEVGRASNTVTKIPTASTPRPPLANPLYVQSPPPPLKPLANPALTFSIALPDTFPSTASKASDRKH